VASVDCIRTNKQIKATQPYVSTGTLKSRDVTTRDWTTRHQIATVDIAGVDNAAQGSGVREQSAERQAHQVVLVEI